MFARTLAPLHRDVNIEDLIYVVDDEKKKRRRWQPGIKWQETSNALLLRSSPIQGLGVFSAGYIPANSMILYYTGEEIRPTVADVRERRMIDRLTQLNLANVSDNAENVHASPSMYMFRRGDDVIIDSTNAGNIARFVNHSCEPNCEAKDVPNLHGKRRIVFKSLRDIMPGEELGYDYKMAPEHPDDRIVCSCGAKNCKKFMNGD